MWAKVRLGIGDVYINIKRTYDYISKNELPKKSLLKKIICKHVLVDNILTSKSGLSRISGEEKKKL